MLQFAGAAALSGSPLVQAAQIALDSTAWLAIGQTGGPYKVVPPVTVVRPLDLLVIDLDWRNLEYVPAGSGRPPRLRRVNAALPAYLILRFPPQHIAEEARTTPPGSGSINHGLSLRSRVVFVLPAQLNEIEYRLPVILAACQRLAMNVSCRAFSPPRCQVAPEVEPPPEETAIEVPYGLVLSPAGDQFWTHALSPTGSADRVELWHTRLAPVAPGNTPPPPDAGPMALRAIHYNTRSLSDVVLPNGAQRREIAHLSSDITLSRFRFPEIVSADRLMLSALGAWLDVRFQYDGPLPAGYSVSGWRHQTVMGRDQFVQVVQEGYLLPFGHRASLIETRERRFADRGHGDLVAYLYKEQVIVVREPVRDYFAGPGTGTAQERDTPFRSVRILTEVTPAIDRARGDRFPVRVGNQNFVFRLSGVDREGQVVDFASPLIFATPAAVAAGIGDYNSQPAPARQIALNGQKVAFVPASGQSDPTLETESVILGVVADADTVSSHPVLQSAQVRVPAVKQLLGSNEPTVVRLPEIYRSDGFQGRNREAQVYLQFAQSLPIGGGAIGGGLAQMQAFLNGLSRATGAVVGPPSLPGQPVKLDQFVAGSFKPEEFFPNARLFGSLRLTEILGTTTFSAADAGGKVPKLAVQPILDGAGVPVAVEATFQFRTSVLKELPFFLPRSATGGAELFIHSRLRKELTGNQAATRMVEGQLSNFSIRLVGNDPFLTLQFRALQFRSQNGERPVVTPDITGVQFGQALKFVDVLSRSLAHGGDGMSLDLVRNGIRAGYTRALPGIGIGMFSLENISLSVGLYLPLTGDEPLSYSFAFGQRFNPFHVAVLLFTGGGYFELELSPRGLLRLEAAVEFGASVALDLGVASGKAEVMAGIRYFMRTSESPDGRAIQLEGYVRASGAIEVLGILSISAMLYLGLTYDFVRNEMWGRATVSVEVKLLFFSKSVSFSYEQRFAGSRAQSASIRDVGPAVPAPLPGLPSFEQYISREQWQSYCAAFA